MKIRMILLSVATCGALAACATAPSTHSSVPAMQPQITNVNMPNFHASYTCRNGMNAHVHYAHDQATITLDTAEQSAVLSRSISASGALYSSQTGFYGKPSEWHEKAGEAILAFSDPYGNHVETNCTQK